MPLNRSNATGVQKHRPGGVFCAAICRPAGPCLDSLDGHSDRCRSRTTWGSKALNRGLRREKERCVQIRVMRGMCLGPVQVSWPVLGTLVVPQREVREPFRSKAIGPWCCAASAGCSCQQAFRLARAACNAFGTRRRCLWAASADPTAMQSRQQSHETTRCRFIGAEPPLGGCGCLGATTRDPTALRHL